MAEYASAAGTGLSMVGSISQGNSNANVADYNADVAGANASTVTQQGAEEARRSLVNTRKFEGQEGAAYGASGVSGGSAQDVMRSTAAQGALNALTITNNAAIKATSYTNEANLDTYRAGNDQMAGYLGAASALTKGLSGGGGGGGSSSGGDDMDYLDEAEDG